MKILISRPDKIGDVILALHAVKQLKTQLPEAVVYLHVSNITKPLVDMVDFVDGVVGFDEDLHSYAFDAVVDLMAKNRTSVKYSSAGIPLRIGNAARWFRFRFNRSSIIRRSRALMNEAEYNWQMIRMLDDSLQNSPLIESLQKEDLAFSASPYDGPSYLVLMPGVTVSARPWDSERWIELATQYVASTEKNVVIVLGPAEQSELEVYRESLDHSPRISIACPENFTELFQILAHADRYVGTSTGVTHLAAVFDLRGVALYPEAQSVHPRRWQPFQSNLQVLSLDRGIESADVLLALEDGDTTSKQPLAREPLSAFVVCCNEEENIRRCLESLRWCDELLVVDSGSTDKTLEICREYTDNIIEQPWLGYSKQKQFALSQCYHKWVLNVDSDEEVSFELRNKIEHLLSHATEKNGDVRGYEISRIVFYLNRWWDKGGWYPEYRLRFFQREFTQWGGIDPHEKAEVSGEIERLDEPIYHYTYEDMDHQIRSLAAHASLSAEGMYERGIRSSLAKIIVRPILRFVKFYLLKGAYRHGFLGLVVGCLESFGTLIKYVRLWEIQKFSKQP